MVCHICGSGQAVFRCRACGRMFCTGCAGTGGCLQCHPKAATAAPPYTHAQAAYAPSAALTESWLWLDVVSFLLPLIGFIIGIIYLSSADLTRHPPGRGAVISATWGFFAYPVFFFVVLPMLMALIMTW